MAQRRLSVVRQVVTDAWRDVLGRDEVASDDSWFSLGGDSASSMQLIRTLQAHLDAELPIAVIFGDPPTLGAMVTAVQDHLVSRQGG